MVDVDVLVSSVRIFMHTMWYELCRRRVYAPHAHAHAHAHLGGASASFEACAGSRGWSGPCRLLHAHGQGEGGVAAEILVWATSGSRACALPGHAHARYVDAKSLACANYAAHLTLTFLGGKCAIVWGSG
jgi:hypothetical protein